MKKNLAIVISMNKDYFFMGYCFILNLKRFFDKFDNIVVFTDDLDENEIRHLKALDVRIIINRYTRTMFEEEFKTRHIDNVKRFIDRFTHITLAKIKILQLLNEYHKVAYFDCDMLITDNIDELFEFDTNCAVTENGHKFCDLIYDVKDTTSLHANLDLLKKKFAMILPRVLNVITFNGGLFIFNDNFDYDRAYRVGSIVLRYMMRYYTSWIDEVIFSIIFCILGLNYTSKPRNIYNCYPPNLEINTKIIHMAGNYKPYSHPLMMCLLREWYQYYNIYLNKTGMPVQYIKTDFREGVHYLTEQINAKQHSDKYKLFIIALIRDLPANLFCNFETTKRYFCIFIKGITKNIHYEVVLGAGKVVWVCLHCEGKVAQNTNSALFKYLSHKINNQSPNPFKIELKSDIENVINDFKYLYSKTIGELLSSDAKNQVDKTIHSVEQACHTSILSEYECKAIQNIEKKTLEQANHIESLNIFTKYNNLRFNITLDNQQNISYLPIYYKDKLTKFHIPFYYCDFIQKRILLNNNYWELPLLEKFGELLRHHKTSMNIFIDAGANIGNHSLFFHTYFGAKTIYAIEPQDLIYNILQKNMVINNVNAKLYKNILSDSESYFAISKFTNSNYGATAFAPATDSTSYKAISLDSLPIDSAVTAIKIDVEGWELPVLKGAQKLLATHHPILWIEIKQHKEVITDLLKGFGYKLEFSRGEDCFFA